MSREGFEQVDKNTFISLDGMVTYCSPYVDEHGNAVERTKDKYPYTYDGFVTWRGGENSEVTGTVYSDRLLQWNYQKTRDLMQKHFGNTGDYYSSRSPKQIQAFLSEYFEEEIELIFIMEYCNVSSGYPLWRFDFKNLKKK